MILRKNNNNIAYVVQTLIIIHTINLHNFYQKMLCYEHLTSGKPLFSPIIVEKE